MSQAPAKPTRGRKAWWRIPLRLAIILAVAFGIGAVLNSVAASLARNAQPAGFGRGVLQGALMPMALPNLLMGKDVVIYSPNNTGVGYKLGYTSGVNACGAVFFGFLYWRLNRLRKWANRNGNPGT
jgi:hypothetical protein